jgi:hypothetical protein
MRCRLPLCYCNGSGNASECDSSPSCFPPDLCRLVPADSTECLLFKCPACDLKLSAGRHQAGISGPCPNCGALVSAPAFTEHASPSPLLNPPPATCSSDSFTRSGAGSSQLSSASRKGRIRADSGLDHRHLEIRETAKTLWVITLFVLAIITCLSVTWFLKDWMKR